MRLSEKFETFCTNLKLDDEAMRTSAGNIAKKLNKVYYDLDKDDSSHLYIVGSVGRKTAINSCSDLDIIFDLPNEIYKKYDNYESNGQSKLLQEVKEYLKELYPKTDISGDGQVVVINFTKYTVEVVPAFKQSDDRFKYPDTHDGGSWKYTNPIPEQEECLDCDNQSKGTYFDFCRLVRAWKNHIGFKFSGILIDTLVYDHFLDNNYYKDKDYEKYEDILKSLYTYLSEQNDNQSFWFAVGSNQKIYNSNSEKFVKKAKKALKILEENNIDESLNLLFGNNFAPDEELECKSKTFEYSNTEEFIEDFVPIDIRYNVKLDCIVSQNGYRDQLLSVILRNHSLLKLDKKLSFSISNIDSNNYDNIYWKVRNVGPIAEKKDCIRGQILKTNETTHYERTCFRGGHYVECYLIKNGVCVARGRIDVPIE